MKKPKIIDMGFNPWQEEDILTGISGLTFSAGEIHMNVSADLKPGDNVQIGTRLHNPTQIMALLLLGDALWSMDVTADVFVPYLPYSRQDRVCNPGDAFSLRVFMRMMMLGRFQRIYTIDVHSMVAHQLSGNLLNFSALPYVEKVVNEISNDELTIVAPDKGATKKTNQYKEKLGIKYFVQASKVRNPADGSLSNFKLEKVKDLHGRPCLIADDICDGGGTFLGLAKELKRKNAGDLYLYVTHGIFSKGIIELNKWYKQVYTTDSILNDPQFLPGLRTFVINYDGRQIS